MGKWVSFKDRKPIEENPLITRGVCAYGKGDCHESWRKWNNELLNIRPPITHWWDGEFDFDKAIMQEI